MLNFTWEFLQCIVLCIGKLPTAALEKSLFYVLVCLYLYSAEVLIRLTHWRKGTHNLMTCPVIECLFITMCTTYTEHNITQAKCHVQCAYLYCKATFSCAVT